MTNQQNKKPFILLVDDEKDHCERIIAAFEHIFDFVTLSSPNDILMEIKKQQNENRNFDAILLDLDFDGNPMGTTLLKDIYEGEIRIENIPIIVVSSFFESEETKHYSLEFTPKLNKNDFDLAKWETLIEQVINSKNERDKVGCDVFIYINTTKDDEEKYIKFRQHLIGYQKMSALNGIVITLYDRTESENTGRSIYYWRKKHESADIVLHMLTPALLEKDEHFDIIMIKKKYNIAVSMIYCVKDENYKDYLHLVLPTDGKFLYKDDMIKNKRCVKVVGELDAIIKKIINPPAPPQK